jgi:hypothetical protein
MLQGMVGTTPVIVGRKLETTYHLTGRMPVFRVLVVCTSWSMAASCNPCNRLQTGIAIVLIKYKAAKGACTPGGGGWPGELS